MIHPGSKASQALAVLRDGPATTGEVAVELGWDVHRACAYLGKLERYGLATRERFPRRDRRVRYLWTAK